MLQDAWRNYSTLFLSVCDLVVQLPQQPINKQPRNNQYTTGKYITIKACPNHTLVHWLLAWYILFSRSNRWQLMYSFSASSCGNEHQILTSMHYLVGNRSNKNRATYRDNVALQVAAEQILLVLPPHHRLDSKVKANFVAWILIS